MGGHSKDPLDSADKMLQFEGATTGAEIASAFIAMMNLRRTNRFAVPFYKAIVKQLNREIDLRKGE